MVRMPAEWAPHERTLMGWPCRPALWQETIEQARADYAAVANAIARFEPVRMIAASPGDAAAARAACDPRVEVTELPIDDSWLRDSGPIYVYRPDESRLAVHFRFNSWGGKFAPWDRDAEIGAVLARQLGDEVREVPMVLEGGAISVDGEGTLITTEQCLLAPNRNPSMSRQEIESVLRSELGADRIVWLGRGLVEDRDTDGHVDLIAAFAPPGRVLLQTTGPENPNFAHCMENRERLRAAGIEVIELPFLPYARVAGEEVAVSYLNLYVCNGAVIVGVTGAASDPEALAIIASAYPGREVVPVPGAVLAFGGGGPHCVTQQVPVRHG